MAGRPDWISREIDPDIIPAAPGNYAQPQSMPRCEDLDLDQSMIPLAGEFFDK
jgi:hypothetical protein